MRLLFSRSPQTRQLARGISPLLRRATHARTRARPRRPVQVEVAGSTGAGSAARRRRQGAPGGGGSVLGTPRHPGRPAATVSGPAGQPSTVRDQPDRTRVSWTNIPAAHRARCRRWIGRCRRPGDPLADGAAAGHDDVHHHLPPRRLRSRSRAAEAPTKLTRSPLPSAAPGPGIRKWPPRVISITMIAFRVELGGPRPGVVVRDGACTSSV